MSAIARQSTVADIIEEYEEKTANVDYHNNAAAPAQAGATA